MTELHIGLQFRMQSLPNKVYKPDGPGTILVRKDERSMPYNETVEVDGVQLKLVVYKRDPRNMRGVDMASCWIARYNEDTSEYTVIANADTSNKIANATNIPEDDVDVGFVVEEEPVSILQSRKRADIDNIAQLNDESNFNPPKKRAHVSDNLSDAVISKNMTYITELQLMIFRNGDDEQKNTLIKAQIAIINKLQEVVYH